MKPQSVKQKDYRKPFNKYRQAKTPYEYLMQRVEVEEGSIDPCWIFTAGKDKNGYGQVQAAKTARELGVTRAHQMSYKIFKGDVPEGMFVCHTCDNPSCVNPNHLFVGTAQDNNDDMWAKGRWRSGAKSKYDHDYIVNQHGIKSCMELSEELGCSYSLICLVWRKHGKKGRNWFKRDKCGI